MFNIIHICQGCLIRTGGGIYYCPVAVWGGNECVWGFGRWAVGRVLPKLTI